MDRQLRDLQDEIDDGLQQRAETQEEIESLVIGQSQLQRDLEKSHGRTAIAINEQYALRDEIVDLEQRLDWTEHRLGQAGAHLREVTDELGVFKQQQPG